MLLKNRLSFVFAAGLSLTLPMPLLAQSATVDTDAIAVACATSAELCEAAVLQAVAVLRGLGLSPAAFNEQLGVVASVVISAARSLPPVELAALAGTVERLALASSNPAQQAALTQLAGDLGAGNPIDLAAFASAISAS